MCVVAIDKRAGVFGLELGADPLEIVEFLHRTPRGGDDHFAAGGQGREALALTDEYGNAEFVLQLPNLFADARLRGKERLRGDGHVHAVVDDGAEVT